MNSRAFRRQRTGFTLIEVLVVIAIVAVLAGLILAAVQVVRVTGRNTANANDILQLAVAMEAFKSQFGCYPPSRVRLLNSGAYDMSETGGKPNTPLDFESKNILMKMWPRLQFGGTLDWSGGTSTAGDWTLEGDQCLVFFLGGIPSANPAGVTGFNTSKTNPTTPGGTRISSFYTNFQAGRLVLIPHGGVTSPFYSYQDVWGTPFAFFSTKFNTQNEYNPYYSYPYNLNISDCQSLGVMPYLAPPPSGVTVQYQNPKKYQIISAGQDQVFGSTTTNGGVIWNPATAQFSLANGGAWPTSFTNPTTGKAIPYPGMDDRTNFCANILSAGGAQ